MKSYLNGEYVTLVMTKDQAKSLLFAADDSASSYSSAAEDADDDFFMATADTLDEVATSLEVIFPPSPRELFQRDFAKRLAEFDKKVL